MILVKFPTRERPQRFEAVLADWVNKADNLDGIHFLFSLDHDDPSVEENALIARHSGAPCTIVRGYSQSKVHAINRDFEHAPEWAQVLVLSDDMHCRHQGWDTEVRKNCEANPDCLVWFPDQRQRSMCTLPCMDRAYYDRYGWIYDPRFKSVFCDDLQTDLAKRDGRLVFVDLTIAHHLHPANVNDLVPDALYRRNETTAIWNADERLYRKLTPYPRK